MKNFKTTRKSYLITLFMAISVATFWACKESNVMTSSSLDEVKLSRLAKTYASEVTDAEYQIFQSEYKSLNEDEFKRFNEIVENNDVKKYGGSMITNNSLETTEPNEAFEKSKKMFGVSFNKLNEKQIIELFDDMESSNKLKNTKVGASCPIIAYGYQRASIVSSGTTNCSSVKLMNVKGGIDCDYECTFKNILPQSYSTLPIYGSTLRMKTLLFLFRSGTILARQSGTNGYVIIGKDRADALLNKNIASTVISNELKMKK